MKIIIKSVLAVFLLTIISCTKQDATIQSSGITNESSTQDLSSDDAVAKITSVKIGSQLWMNTNLNVSRYRNGDKIPQVKDPSKWAGLTTGAWCWYNNNPANGTIYGKLYNWYAVNDPRGLAPTGWHIPSDAEWTVVVNFLGGDIVAGGKMKETGTANWKSPNTGATNTSGFTGMPGGLRNFTGTFENFGNYGYWWSSTPYSIDQALERYLSTNYGNCNLSAYGGRYGLSVRCIKD
jgi:uncharacterized protein (TIGR02145 family)